VRELRTLFRTIFSCGFSLVRGTTACFISFVAGEPLVRGLGTVYFISSETKTSSVGPPHIG